MELTYDRKLCLIESLRRCNMSAIEIHNIVETAWPNEAGTVRSIQKIVKRFKDGERTSFDRIEGQGKPTSLN